MDTIFNGQEWNTVTRIDGKSFLGFAPTEHESRVRVMELVRDYNEKKLRQQHILEIL